MLNYLQTKYSFKKRPVTDFPSKLVKYLADSYFDKSHKKIIDIGCGRGDFLKSFHHLGYEVEGSDYDSYTIECCAPHKVHIVDIQKEKLSIKDGSKDIVFSKSVIEHLHEPEKLLNESHRILRDKGKIILMTPSWVHMGWGPFYQDHTHVRPWTKPALIDILNSSGFKNIHVRHFRQLPITWKYPITENIFRIIRRLPIPYRPQHEVNYSEKINKIVRWSKEVLLLAVAEK